MGNGDPALLVLDDFPRKCEGGNCFIETFAPTRELESRDRQAEGNSDSKPVGAAEMIARHGGRDKKTRTKNWYVDGEAD